MEIQASGKAPWIKWIMAFILIGNILEAVVQDILRGGLFHSMNAVAGLLLLPACFAIHNMMVTAPGKDLEWEATTIPWIIGYTIWNWTFVVLNISVNTLNQIIILGIPLVIGFIKPKIWLQARAYTLGTFMILFFSGPDIFDKFAYKEPENEFLYMITSSLSLGFMVLYSGYYIQQKLFSKGEKTISR